MNRCRRVINKLRKKAAGKKKGKYDLLLEVKEAEFLKNTSDGRILPCEGIHTSKKSDPIYRYVIGYYQYHSIVYGSIVNILAGKM